MSCRAFCRHASIAVMVKRKDCCGKDMKTSRLSSVTYASTSAFLVVKCILTASVVLTATPCIFASVEARSCKVHATGTHRAL